MIRNVDTTAEDEQDLLESTERGEWISIGLSDERRAFWREFAHRALSRRLDEDGPSGRGPTRS